jgi:hypothetical protein
LTDTNSFQEPISSARRTHGRRSPLVVGAEPLEQTLLGVVVVADVAVAADDLPGPPGEAALEAVAGRIPLVVAEGQTHQGWAHPPPELGTEAAEAAAWQVRLVPQRR